MTTTARPAPVRAVDQIPANHRPPERLIEIYRAFEAGESVSEIGRRFNLAAKTVSSYWTGFRQATRDEKTRHPKIKTDQISRFLGILRASYKRCPRFNVYDVFGNHDGDTATAYKLAGCLCENHPYDVKDKTNTDFFRMIGLHLIGATTLRHVIDIDAFGWQAMELLEMRVVQRLANSSLLFVTFPKPQLARANHYQLFKAQQILGVAGVYNQDNVMEWIEHQISKDCFKIVTHDVQDMDNLWRIALHVKRCPLGSFIHGRVV